jgi:hypothetical protein
MAHNQKQQPGQGQQQGATHECRAAVQTVRTGPVQSTALTCSVLRMAAWSAVTRCPTVRSSSCTAIYRRGSAHCGWAHNTGGSHAITHSDKDLQMHVLKSEVRHVLDVSAAGVSKSPRTMHRRILPVRPTCHCVLTYCRSSRIGVHSLACWLAHW